MDSSGRIRVRAIAHHRHVRANTEKAYGISFSWTSAAENAKKRTLFQCRMKKTSLTVDLERAFHSRDVKEFMDLVLPPEWAGVKARILETGVIFASPDEPQHKFALGWSFITPTMRLSKRDDDRETWFKSIIFRVHDVLHQLFSLYVPQTWTPDELHSLKRMWMCAEISVLTLTEFVYCQWLYETQPHLREFLEHRNTLLFKNTTQLSGKNPQDIASVLDQLLHLKARPKWVTDSPYGVKFLNDFVPMLEEDRVNIDHNLNLLSTQKDKDYLRFMPTPCYGNHLDGRELTVWMIKYFETLLDTGSSSDEMLRSFNESRRSRINLPDTWNSPHSTELDVMWEKLELRGYNRNQ
jgi:hypothetical protein